MCFGLPRCGCWQTMSADTPEVSGDLVLSLRFTFSRTPKMKFEDLTMVIMKITVSWDVRSCSLVERYEPFENRVSGLLRNVGNVPLHHTASHPRKQYCSTSRRESNHTHSSNISKAHGLTLWHTRTKRVGIINKNYTQEEINTGFGACLLRFGSQSSASLYKVIT
jgi:hypothetical protein